MNIYDEAKVITHEQARKQIQSTNEYLETNIDPFGSFETYINQQLKKEERAKKVEELLELYKKLNNIYEKLYTMELSLLSLNSNYYEIEIIKIKQQINLKEKELGEIK